MSLTVLLSALGLFLDFVDEVEVAAKAVRLRSARMLCLIRRNLSQKGEKELFSEIIATALSRYCVILTPH